MAENQHTPDTPTASATREDFDAALCDANVIAGIIDDLASADLSAGATVRASHFLWLAEELKGRLERIEVADMTMRRCRA